MRDLGNGSPVTNGREPQSPFLNAQLSESIDQTPAWAGAQSESPFLHEYAESNLADELELAPSEALVAEFLDDIHDEELDEAVERLVDETSAVAASYPAMEGESEAGTEMILREYLAPLALASERLVDGAAEAFANVDAAMATDLELEATLERVPLPAMARSGARPRGRHGLRSR